MKGHVELKIPFTGYRSPFEFRHDDKAMAAAIASMVGREPVCYFLRHYLFVEFSPEDFDQIKTWYGRKWRSNVTHEIKRHCRMNYGLKPELRHMQIHFYFDIETEHLKAQSFQ